MKRGDLVRVRRPARSRSRGAVDAVVIYSPTLPRGQGVISPGEVLVLLEDYRASFNKVGYIYALHPQHGICTILRRSLEAV